MGNSEDLRDAGAWSMGECPRCDAEEEHVRWLRGKTLRALRCNHCKLLALGKTDATVDRDFHQARGRYRLGQHPEIRWEVYAASATGPGREGIPKTVDGTLVRSTEDVLAPAGISIDLSFGDRGGTSGCQIQDAALRKKVLVMLEQGTGKPMDEILRWKVPDAL